MKRTISGLFVVLALSATSMVAVAEEDHGIGKILTEELDLTYIDHVLAGRVGDRPIYAVPVTGEFGMRLLHRAGGVDFESVLRSVDGEYVATVDSVSIDGENTVIDFRINSVSAADGLIKGFLGERPFSVQISSDTMNGHHYVDPQFDIDVDGTLYSFTLEGGQACMGCALKISYAVIAMLSAYGTL